MGGKKRKSAMPKGNHIKRRKVDDKPQLRLWDIPAGPLQLILSKVDWDKQLILRHASEKLMNAHSECILHRYRLIISQNLRTPDDTSEGQLNLIMIQVLRNSTEFFINSGFDCVFTSRLVEFCEMLPENEVPIDVGQMQKFLNLFYNDMAYSLTYPIAVADQFAINQNRFLHTVTLLHLLRNFHSFRVVSSGMNLFHWHITMEIWGLEFGVQEHRPRVSDEEKLADFLSILAELLVFELDDKKLSRYIEVGNISYLYARKEPRKSTRSPKLKVKLSIFAPTEVRQLLLDVIDGKVDMYSKLSCPCDSTFSIHMEVKSRHINLWSGTNAMKVCILPLN